MDADRVGSSASSEDHAPMRPRPVRSLPRVGALESPAIATGEALSERATHPLERTLASRRGPCRRYALSSAVAPTNDAMDGPGVADPARGGSAPVPQTCRGPAAAPPQTRRRPGAWRMAVPAANAAGSSRSRRSAAISAAAVRRSFAVTACSSVDPARRPAISVSAYPLWRRLPRNGCCGHHGPG